VFGRTSTPDPTAPKPATTPAPSQLGTMTPSPIGAAPTQPAPSATRASPFGAASTLGSSVIGTDLTILGEKITIISQNRLQIDGDVRGDVNGRQVVIGEEGSVIGTICAEAIEVKGGVRGAIRANSVTVQPTAVVEGDVHHVTLSIAEGAQFDGRVKRAKDPAELKPNLNVESFASQTPSSAPVPSPMTSGPSV
jgi:cytoskeletal protein CcmA (bactofilin family)